MMLGAIDVVERSSCLTASNSVLGVRPKCSEFTTELLLGDVSPLFVSVSNTLDEPCEGTSASLLAGELYEWLVVMVGSARTDG